MKFVFGFHLACISLMLMFQIVSTLPHSPKHQEDCVTADEGSLCLCKNPSLYVKGFWRNDPPQDSYPRSLRCGAAITSNFHVDYCRFEGNWSIDLTTHDRNISCPNAFFVSGLYFPSRDRYFTYIYCCPPRNHPESYEECYVEDVFSTSFNGADVSECQRKGYFITGFYEKNHDSSPFPLPRLEKFYCCKMAGNCVLFVTSIPDCRKL
ncbi:unnamed protein product [Porites lobata]|uniref:Uncharacterized protein n=1 Tax=Porites lobata TaxID=104759 RepID=A0ABN8R0N2_9CNID|nr:unnamed protein product [Porites lobata]